jgi:hypothetical protein
MSDGDWALLITAIFSGIATMITAYAGLVKSKKEARTEGAAECLELLKAARREAEEHAAELHRLRMSGAT